MGYQVIKFQNVPKGDIPTICIEKGSPIWELAYKNWISGKDPTDSKEWKKGIFALTTLLKKET
jgi:hypothetical protein